MCRGLPVFGFDMPANGRTSGHPGREDDGDRSKARFCIKDAAAALRNRIFNKAYQCFILFGIPVGQRQRHLFTSFPKTGKRLQNASRRLHQGYIKAQMAFALADSGVHTMFTNTAMASASGVMSDCCDNPVHLQDD